MLALAFRAASERRAPQEAEIVGCRELVPALGTLPLEVVRTGLEAILTASDAGLGLEVLRRCGGLEVLLPEVAATVGLAQEAGRRHKDVWEHTKTVVEQSPPTSVLRWSALLHDIGKVKTRRFGADGSVTFHRHESVGARMFDRIGLRLEMPGELRLRVRFLVLMHLRANAYVDSWTDAAVRRFDLEMGEHLDDLLDLSMADVTSRRAGRRAEVAANLAALRRRVLELRERDAKQSALPAGLGNAIMAALSLAPSPEVGRLRSLCERAVEDGILLPRQPLEYYVDYLSSHGPLVGVPGGSPATSSFDTARDAGS